MQTTKKVDNVDTVIFYRGSLGCHQAKVATGPLAGDPQVTLSHVECLP